MFNDKRCEDTVLHYEKTSILTYSIILEYQSKKMLINKRQNINFSEAITFCDIYMLWHASGSRSWPRSHDHSTHGA